MSKVGIIYWSSTGNTEAMAQAVEEGAKAAGESAQAKVEGGEEEYGFCTEFILKLSENGVRHFSETSFKDELATIGNSIVCVQDEDLVKVHVHTLEPFTAIKMGRRQGRFIKLKVETIKDILDLNLNFSLVKNNGLRNYFKLASS